MKKMVGSEENTWNPMLILDLVRSVLERLSFGDFHRARCVSSVWYSASKSCMVPRTTNPWLILFPEEHVDNGSCKLFDPSDNRSYTLRDLGFDFARSRCLTNYGNWFLMLDHRTDLYIFNIFTRERIPLPSLESIHEQELIEFKRISDSSFEVKTFQASSKFERIFYGRIDYSSLEVKTLKFSDSDNLGITSACLWVDESSRDYLVVWNFRSFYAYHKKGDVENRWRVFQFQPLGDAMCLDMAFIKPGKLYVLNGHGDRDILGDCPEINVFDFFSGDSPTKSAWFPTPDGYPHSNSYVRNLVVTLSGDLVILVRAQGKFSFSYKMKSKSSKWTGFSSLKGEAFVLDLSMTVAAKDEHVLENCIYYSTAHHKNTASHDIKDICVYDIKTEDIVRRFNHLTDSSPISFRDARWFLPVFGAKSLR